jgi:hypothetical protein
MERREPPPVDNYAYGPNWSAWQSPEKPSTGRKSESGAVVTD